MWGDLFHSEIWDIMDRKKYQKLYEKKKDLIKILQTMLPKMKIRTIKKEKERGKREKKGERESEREKKSV